MRGDSDDAGVKRPSTSYYNGKTYGWCKRYSTASVKEISETDISDGRWPAILDNHDSCDQSALVNSIFACSNFDCKSMLYEVRCVMITRSTL